MAPRKSTPQAPAFDTDALVAALMPAIGTLVEQAVAKAMQADVSPAPAPAPAKPTRKTRARKPRAKKAPADPFAAYTGTIKTVAQADALREKLGVNALPDACYAPEIVIAGRVSSLKRDRHLINTALNVTAQCAWKDAPCTHNRKRNSKYCPEHGKMARAKAWAPKA